MLFYFVVIRRRRIVPRVRFRNIISIRIRIGVVRRCMRGWLRLRIWCRRVRFLLIVFMIIRRNMVCYLCVFVFVFVFVCFVFCVLFVFVCVLCCRGVVVLVVLV